MAINLLPAIFMTLYKYLNSERIDVLQNLKIRLTQPLYLNDPYETNPVITGMETTNEQWNTISQIECERNGLDIKDFEHLKDKDIRDQLFPEALQLIKVFFHHTTGILSLSETYDDPLMWAHYCQNHSGFVIGLKTDNSFFSTTHKNYTIDNLSQVIYTDTRPNITLEMLSMRNLYFTKSNHWNYEREWRLLKNIEKTETKLLDGEVSLFNIPAEIIESVFIRGSNSMNWKIKF